MKLVFLGTRANIDERTRRHRRHAALLVRHRGRSVLVDCGSDWLGRVPRVGPDAVVITHGHPDHVEGLRAGAPFPVFAAGEHPVADRRRPNRVFDRERLEADAAYICGHSWGEDPAVTDRASGHRASGTAVGACIFYVPDVVSIRDRRAALTGVQLYVGDGSTLTRRLVRRRGAGRIGHTMVRDQLAWCREEGVSRAVFTHCGSPLVRADGRRVAAFVRGLGLEFRVAAGLAHDGMCVEINRVSTPISQ